MEKGVFDMGKRQQDKVTGFGAALFGIAMIFLIIPNWVVTSDALNLTSPDTFPKFASWMLVILGAALLLKTYIEEHSDKKNAKTAQESNLASGSKPPKEAFNLQKALKSEGFCVIATFLVIALFGLLLEPLGYLLSSMLCCTLLLIAYQCRKWYYYATVILFTLALHYIFGTLLHVRIP